MAFYRFWAIILPTFGGLGKSFRGPDDLEGRKPAAAREHATRL